MYRPKRNFCDERLIDNGEWCHKMPGSKPSPQELHDSWEEPTLFKKSCVAMDPHSPNLGSPVSSFFDFPPFEAHSTRSSQPGLSETSSSALFWESNPDSPIEMSKVLTSIKKPSEKKPKKHRERRDREPIDPDDNETTEGKKEIEKSDLSKNHIGNITRGGAKEFLLDKNNVYQPYLYKVSLDYQELVPQEVDLPQEVINYIKSNLEGKEYKVKKQPSNGGLSYQSKVNTKTDLKEALFKSKKDDLVTIIIKIIIRKLFKRFFKLRNFVSWAVERCEAREEVCCFYLEKRRILRGEFRDPDKKLKYK